MRNKSDFSTMTCNWQKFTSYKNHARETKFGARAYLREDRGTGPMAEYPQIMEGNTVHTLIDGKYFYRAVYYAGRY